MTHSITSQEGCWCQTRPPLRFVVSARKQYNFGRAYRIGKMHRQCIITDDQRGLFYQCGIFCKCGSPNQAFGSRSKLTDCLNHCLFSLSTGNENGPAPVRKQMSNGAKALHRIASSFSTRPWMQENIWLPWIKSCTFKQSWHSCPCFIRNGYYKLPFSHVKTELFN